VLDADVGLLPAMGDTDKWRWMNGAGGLRTAVTILQSMASAQTSEDIWANGGLCWYCGDGVGMGTMGGS